MKEKQTMVDNTEENHSKRQPSLLTILLFIFGGLIFFAIVLFMGLFGISLILLFFLLYLFIKSAVKQAKK